MAERPPVLPPEGRESNMDQAAFAGDLAAFEKYRSDTIKAENEILECVRLSQQAILESKVLIKQIQQLLLLDVQLWKTLSV
jgi:hypothetical protein